MQSSTNAFFGMYVLQWHFSIQFLWCSCARAMNVIRKRMEPLTWGPLEIRYDSSGGMVMAVLQIIIIVKINLWAGHMLHGICLFYCCPIKNDMIFISNMFQYMSMGLCSHRWPLFGSKLELFLGSLSRFLRSLISISSVCANVHSPFVIQLTRMC